VKAETRRNLLFVAGALGITALSRLLKKQPDDEAEAIPRTVVSSEPAKPRREVVASTLPLELGEGDSREKPIPVYPPDGAPSFEVPSGTRIDRLKHFDEYGPPPMIPECSTCQVRIRITSGARTGFVGYVHAQYVQAAR
jgi:hypothetical protein